MRPETGPTKNEVIAPYTMKMGSFKEPNEQ